MTTRKPLTLNAGKFQNLSDSDSLSIGAYLSSTSSNPATTGLLRVANNEVIVAARNAANDGNITILNTDGSNNVLFGTGSYASQLLGSSITIGTFTGLLQGASGTVSAVTSTQGSILYHNGSAWTALTYGAAGKVLQTNGVGADPTWETVSGGSFTAGGDLTGNSSSQTVVNLSGSSNIVTISAGTLNWTNSTNNPKLSQADNSTASATGYSLTIQAQNATGTTSTGGNIIISSGTGTSEYGALYLQTGGTNRLGISGPGVVNIPNLTASQYVKTDGSKNLVSSSTVTIGDLTVGSQAQGDIIYYNGSSWTRLGAGTSGQVLKTNGTGANPSWGSMQFYYLSDMAYADSGTTTANDGPITVGVQFRVIKAKSCTGIRVCWKIPSGTATTTVKLRRANGTLLASGTFLATTTKTIYTVTFGSPVDLSSYIGEYLTAAVYAPSDSTYMVDSSRLPLGGTADVLVGDGTLYLQSCYAYNDANPTNYSGAYYPVDPILI